MKKYPRNLLVGLGAFAGALAILALISVFVWDTDFYAIPLAVSIVSVFTIWLMNKQNKRQEV